MLTVRIDSICCCAASWLFAILPIWACTWLPIWPIWVYPSAKMYIYEIVGWIFSIWSSMELYRFVVGQRHGHLPFCPRWVCPWTKVHITETAGGILSTVELSITVVYICSCAVSWLFAHWLHNGPKNLSNLVPEGSRHCGISETAGQIFSIWSFLELSRPVVSSWWLLPVDKWTVMEVHQEASILWFEFFLGALIQEPQLNRINHVKWNKVSSMKFLFMFQGLWEKAMRIVWHWQRFPVQA